MHRTPRIARKSLVACALSALVVLPVVASAFVQRARPAINPKLRNELVRLGRQAKRLSSERKEGLTSLTSSSMTAVPQGNASSIFTNAAATDQASIIGYFAGEKMAIVKIGLPFLKPEFIGKQLRTVGSLFPDTGAEKLAQETATKIESGKFDEAEVNKNIDTLVGALSMNYSKKGEAANFNFQAGSTMGVATVLAVLYGVEDFDMQKQVKNTFAKVMEDAKTVAKQPAGDLQDAPKNAFMTFTQAKISDQDTAFAAIKPVDDAYIAALTE